jgi:FkbM family methyltransferase
MTVNAALEMLLANIHRPLRLIDVGARWGRSAAWDGISAISEILCFEPDAEEAARLNETASPNVKYVPVALGGADGELDIHITRQPACSSAYPPIPKLYENYPDLFDTAPEKTETVRCRTLDGILSELEIESVDCIKIDTQGSELNILRGAEKALVSCALLDIEVIFNPLYEGQPLFCDIDQFMRDHGFTLWRIADLVHYATESDVAPPLNFMLAHSPPQRILNSPAPGGQLFWGDAQYVRTEFPRTGSDHLERESGIRAAVVIANQGFWDLTLEILSKCDLTLSRSVRDALTKS